MKLTNLLIAAMTLEMFFLISRKFLTRFGTTVSCLSWKKMVYLPNLHDILQDFSYNRIFSWTNTTAGVPQGSILGPLFFLIYINNLLKGLSSNVKLFTDDASLFSVQQYLKDRIK